MSFERVINRSVHTKKRMLERYGINLCPDSYDELFKKLLSKSYKIVLRISRSEKHIRVNFKGKKIDLLVGYKPFHIITALPPGAKTRVQHKSKPLRQSLKSSFKGVLR